ncbi:hypothetical protein ACFE04_012565 [Oxalis oulophora]
MAILVLTTTLTTRGGAASASASASAGLRLSPFNLIHHHHINKLQYLTVRKNHQYHHGRSNSKIFSQPQNPYTSRIQPRIHKLPELLEDILQTSLNTGPRGAIRLAQGIQAFLGVGAEWLTDLQNSTSVNSSSSSSISSGLPTELQLGLLSPVYLRKLFERMGATYIKLGQFIASAPTLFPEDYVEEFQKCFDKAPTVPFQEIQSILRQELGRPLDTVYDYIDPIPLASASIAQVHAAKLKGSQVDVVIKVLKPGIEDILVADLNFIYVVSRILEFLNPNFSRASLLDLSNFAWNFICRFGSLLACESFHADVHAGNLWLLRDGRIGFLDFGIVGRISRKTWAAMEIFLASIATEEYESMASSLIQMGATDKDVDAKAFARDLEKIFSSIQELDSEIVVATGRDATAVSANVIVDERQMNALFLDVIRVSESYGLKFPREFALLMKQLLYFDRYTRLLAPNMNMLRDERISIVSNRNGSRNPTTIIVDV